MTGTKDLATGSDGLRRCRYAQRGPMLRQPIQSEIDALRVLVIEIGNPCEVYR